MAFRLTINGNFEDFEDLDQLCDYLKKNWKEKTTCADIRRFSKDNCIKFIVNRN